MVFILIFIHHFLLFVNTFTPNTGCINTTLEDRFLLLFYLIPFFQVPSCIFSRTLSLLNFNVLLKPQDGNVFNISFIGNKVLIVYRTIWYFNWLLFCFLTSFITLHYWFSYNCTIVNFVLIVRRRNQRLFWNIMK